MYLNSTKHEQCYRSYRSIQGVCSNDQNNRNQKLIYGCSRREFISALMQLLTIRHEMLILAQKHPHVVWIKVGSVLTKTIENIRNIGKYSNHAPQAVGWGHNGGSSFTREYIEKIFQNRFIKNYQSRSILRQCRLRVGSNEGIKFCIGIYREISLKAVVVNFVHFSPVHIILQTRRANINQTWHKASFGKRNSLV